MVRGLGLNLVYTSSRKPSGAGAFLRADGRLLLPGTWSWDQPQGSSLQLAGLPRGAGTASCARETRPGGILAAGRRGRGSQAPGAPSLTLLVSYRQGAECTSVPLWGQSCDADTPRRW